LRLAGGSHEAKRINHLAYARARAHLHSSGASRALRLFRSLPGCECARYARLRVSFFPPRVAAKPAGTNWDAIIAPDRANRVKRGESEREREKEIGRING